MHDIAEATAQFYANRLAKTTDEVRVLTIALEHAQAELADLRAATQPADGSQ